MVVAWHHTALADRLEDRQITVRRATNGRDKYMRVRSRHPLLYRADTLVPGAVAESDRPDPDRLRH
jgi:hypothetical protein